MPGLRLLAVHAHPDDESSKGAATMARYVAEGHDVLVATATGGEAGSILNPAMDTPEVRDNISAVRNDEMSRAAAALGVSHLWMGYVDSGLPEGDPLPALPEGSFATLDRDVPTQKLVRIIREFRPHVVITYDENGGYPHPDHVMTHRVSVAAFEAAGDPEAHPHAGEPWQPLKLYYIGGFSRDRMVALHEAVLEEGRESPFVDWLERTKGRPQRPVTTFVPCSDFFDQRDDALRAHATQIDPDGFFFAVGNDVQARIWPTEEYELVLSHVPTEDREEDLFAGIPESLAEADALGRRTDLELLRDDRVTPTVREWA